MTVLPNALVTFQSNEDPMQTVAAHVQLTADKPYPTSVSGGPVYQWVVRFPATLAYPDGTLIGVDHLIFTDYFGRRPTEAGRGRAISKPVQRGFLPVVQATFEEPA